MLVVRSRGRASGSRLTPPGCQSGRTDDHLPGGSGHGAGLRPPGLTRRALHPDPAERLSPVVRTTGRCPGEGRSNCSGGRQRALPSVVPAWRSDGRDRPRTGAGRAGAQFLEKLAEAANVSLPSSGIPGPPMSCIRTAPGNPWLSVVLGRAPWTRNSRVSVSSGMLRCRKSRRSPGRLQIDLARGFWDLWAGRQPRLEIEILLPTRGPERPLRSDPGPSARGRRRGAGPLGYSRRWGRASLGESPRSISGEG